MAILKAGAAQTNITPPLGAYLAGSLKARHATEVHDELHAKALVLDDGATQLAFVICDVICIPREVCDAAKALIAEHTCRDSGRTSADSGDSYAFRPCDEAGV